VVGGLPSGLPRIALPDLDPATLRELAPAALANAIVRALRDGIEDVYPGDVAQEWLDRWRDNPKVLERELAAGA